MAERYIDPELKKSVEFLQCVKCGSRDNLFPFKFSREKYVFTFSTKYDLYRHEQIFVPTCSDCFKDFSEWEKEKERKNQSFMRVFYCFSFLILIISLGLLFLMGIYGLIFVFIVSVVFILIFAFIEFLRNKHFKSLESSPTHNIKIRKGTVYIKPLDSLDWINYNNWIKTVVERPSQQSIYNSNVSSSSTLEGNSNTSSNSQIDADYIYCRKCRYRSRSTEKFCSRCGFPLS